MQLAGAVHGQEKAAGDTKLRHKAVGTDNAPEDQASESFGAQASANVLYIPLGEQSDLCVHLRCSRWY